MPSPRLLILHYGPTTLIHIFTPPVSNTLSQCRPPPTLLSSVPMLTRTLWSHAAARGCATGPFSVNTMGLKLRGKAVSTEALPREFQKEIEGKKKRASGHALCTHKRTRTHTHGAIAETHCILRTDRKFNKELCYTKSFILIHGKNIQNSVLFSSNNVSDRFSLSSVNQFSAPTRLQAV